jgi:hypothetical protein
VHVEFVCERAKRLGHFVERAFAVAQLVDGPVAESRGCGSLCVAASA